MANDITGNCEIGDEVVLVPDSLEDILPPGYLDIGTLDLTQEDIVLDVDPLKGLPITGECFEPVPDEDEDELCPCPPELSPGSIPAGINIDTIVDGNAPEAAKSHYRHGYHVMYGHSYVDMFIFDDDLQLVHRIDTATLGADGTYCLLSNGHCFNDDGSVMYITYFQDNNKKYSYIAHIDTTTWTITERHLIRGTDTTYTGPTFTAMEYINGHLYVTFESKYIQGYPRKTGMAVYSTDGYWQAGFTGGAVSGEKFRMIYMGGYIYIFSYKSFYGDRIVKMNPSDFSIVLEYDMPVPAGLYMDAFSALIHDLGNVAGDSDRIGIFYGSEYGYAIMDTDLNVLYSNTSATSSFGAGMARYDETILVGYPNAGSYQGVSYAGAIYAHALDGSYVTRLTSWASSSNMISSYSAAGIILRPVGYLTVGGQFPSTSYRKLMRYNFLIEE